MTAAAGFLSPTGYGPELLVLVSVIIGIIGILKYVPLVIHFIARGDAGLRAIIGDEEQPGLVDSLAKQATATQALSDRLGLVEKELKPNSGTSMRDAITDGIKEAKAAAEDAKHAALASGRDATAVAEQVAAQLADVNMHAGAERAQIANEVSQSKEMTMTLLDALAQYAAEGHTKEMAYIRGLKALGIDLTHIADATVEDTSDDH